MDLRIGELARRTGISVRTLHHYEKIELLRPSARTPAGHRIYTQDDLERLQQIVSLRDLGLALAEIRLCLDVDRASLRNVLEAHRRALDDRMEHYRKVRQRIDSMLDRLAVGRVDGATLVKGIQQMQKDSDAEFTERRRARAAEVGFELFSAAIGENKRIMREVAACRERDLPAEHPELLELALRSSEVREFLTGGTPCSRPCGDAGMTKPGTATARARIQSSSSIWSSRRLCCSLRSRWRPANVRRGCRTELLAWMSRLRHPSDPRRGGEAVERGLRASCCAPQPELCAGAQLQAMGHPAGDEEDAARFQLMATRRFDEAATADAIEKDAVSMSTAWHTLKIAG